MVTRRYTVWGLRKNTGTPEINSFAVNEEFNRHKFFFFSEKKILPRAYLCHRIEARERAEEWMKFGDYQCVRIYSEIAASGWPEEDFEEVKIWEDGLWVL